MYADVTTNAPERTKIVIMRTAGLENDASTKLVSSGEMNIVSVYLSSTGQCSRIILIYLYHSYDSTSWSALVHWTYCVSESTCWICVSAGADLCIKTYQVTLGYTYYYCCSYLLLYNLFQSKTILRCVTHKQISKAEGRTLAFHTHSKCTQNKSRRNLENGLPCNCKIG